MSPYNFTDVLVALDRSAGAAKALDCALSVSVAVGARLTALAVEGRLPAYAASLGEVEREKDTYFRGVLDAAAKTGARSGRRAQHGSGARARGGGDRALRARPRA
jgi:nucleotide-binding universal stress UspA family protein